MDIVNIYLNINDVLKYYFCGYKMSIYYVTLNNSAIVLVLCCLKYSINLNSKHFPTFFPPHMPTKGTCIIKIIVNFT